MKEETQRKQPIKYVSCCSPQAYRGSVKPFVDFNAKHDAELLQRAMKGMGQFSVIYCYYSL